MGYTVGSEGITPSRDKVEAIEVWPEVLQNDTQVKQFLGTINYCQMCMGPAFVDLARPLVELTRKGVDLKSTDEPTQAAKTLNDKLVNYLALQMPDPAKPYALKSLASGYAVEQCYTKREYYWAS